MGRDVGDAERLEPVGAGRLHARARRFVKPDRHIELLAGRPERVIERVVPRLVVIDVGAQKDRLHAELQDGAAGFGDRARNIVRRHAGGAEQALRIGRPDVIVEPVVVGAAHRGGEARIHMGEGGRVHAGGREQDREVQPFLVHGLDLRFRIEIAGDLFGVALGHRGLFRGAQCRPVAARDLRHDLALDERADVPFALAEPARRAVAELAVDIALPQIRGLHDMHLGIDQPEAVSRHRVLPDAATIAHAVRLKRRWIGAVRPSRRAFLGAPQDDEHW